MSRYRKIHVKMWSSPDFLALSAPKPNGRDLFVHLLTGPHTTAIPGVFCAGKARLAEDLGWPLRSWERCWSEIESRHMARADWTSRLVFLPGALAHNPPRNPNEVRAWRDEWALLPRGRLLDEIESAFGTFLAGLGVTYADAWANVRRNVPSTVPGGFSTERQPERSVEPSTEPGTEASRDMRMRPRVRDVLPPDPDLRSPEGEPGDGPTASDLHRLWVEAITSAGGGTPPGLPDSPKFDRERDVLRSLWTERSASGDDWAAFGAWVRTQTRAWTAATTDRRAWWWTPSRFAGWRMAASATLEATHAPTPPSHAWHRTALVGDEVPFSPEMARTIGGRIGRGVT